MATISRTKTWAASETLTASDLNAEFDNIIATANGNLNAANLGVTAGIAAAVEGTGAGCQPRFG